MDRHHPIAVLFTLWLPLFFLGCDRAHDGRKAGPASEARPEPVLTTEDVARTIVSKAVKAHGGEKAFSRWSCGYLKYTTKGGMVPAQLGEVTLEDTFQLPGHFKRVTRIDAGRKDLLMVFVINHGKGWSKKGDAPAEAIDNDFTAKTEHPFAAFCNLAPLTEADVRLTKLAAEKVDGKDAIGIRAQSEKLGEVDFYLGMQTGLLLKSRKSVPSVDADKPSVMESFLGDYKDVDGTQVPMRLKGTQDGTAIMDMTVIEVRFADEFMESTFAKP